MASPNSVQATDASAEKMDCNAQTFAPFFCEIDDDDDDEGS